MNEHDRTAKTRMRLSIRAGCSFGDLEVKWLDAVLRDLRKKGSPLARQEVALVVARKVEVMKKRIVIQKGLRIAALQDSMNKLREHSSPTLSPPQSEDL